MYHTPSRATVMLSVVSAALLALPAVEPRLEPLEDVAVTQAVDLLRLNLVLPEVAARTIRDTVQKYPLHLALTRSEGTWSLVSVTVPGFNRGRHAGTITANTSTAERLQLTVALTINDDQWVTGDPAATCTVDVDLTGEPASVTGTFTTTVLGETVTGEVRGTRTTAGWRGGAEATPAGYRVDWDMGARRVGWNHARWAVYELSRTADFTASDGLHVAITTATLRHDTAVDVAVMEEDGSWWHVHAAVPLTTPERSMLIDFDDMRQAEFVFDAEGTRAGMDGNWDEDFRLDTSRIRRVAVGVVDGSGIGPVAFTITSVQRAQWKERAPVTANLALAGTLAINGQDQVPGGIFGFHVATNNLPVLAPLRPGSNRTCTALSYGRVRMDKPVPEHGTDFMVTGIYDRKQQLPQANAKSAESWREATVTAGRAIGELALPLGKAAVVEWWNEPYLELGRFLDGFKQLPYPNPDGIKPGDPVVHLGEPLASMIWIEGRLVGTGKNAKKVFDVAKGPIWRPDESKPESDVGTPTLFAVDPTRFTYWSGKQIGEWYNETFVIMAKEALAIAPELKLVGGFGFRWQEDNWESWRMLHQPLVDVAWEYLDGLCDHRYQGLPEGTLASYEFLAAYTDVRYGKRLKGYNTEANDLWDAPARGGSIQDSAEQKRHVARRRAFWNLRDLALTVDLVPDKAVARAIHAQWKVDPAKLPADPQPWQVMGIHEGEYRALHLLRNLRGRLIAVRNDDPTVIAAASADHQTSQVVMVIYNDDRESRTIHLDLAAPAGTTLTTGTRTLLAADTQGQLATTTVAQEPGMTQFDLAAGSAVCIELPFTGELPAASEVTRHQRFADGFLQQIAPGTSLTLPLPGTPEAGARSVRARVVLERCTQGEGWIEVAGHRVAIPHSPTVPNTPRIVFIDLPLAAAAASELVIGANGPEAGDGFLLCAASIEVER